MSDEFNRILAVINKGFGFTASLAIEDAIKVARDSWNKNHTHMYGTSSRDFIRDNTADLWAPCSKDMEKA